MSGKDVARDAADFEKTLPLELQTLMQELSSQQRQLMSGGVSTADLTAGPASGAEPLSEAEARRIVEAAAQDGKLSETEAKELLAASSQHESQKGNAGSESLIDAPKSSGKLGQFWKNLTSSKTPKI